MRVCACVRPSVCSLFLMRGHRFERTCTKFGTRHLSYTLQMVMGLASAARAHGLTLGALESAGATDRAPYALVGLCHIFVRL